MSTHYTLKQLQHLVLLAEDRHFARAAGRAALSQSAFSRSIQSLELALGLQLFDRDMKLVSPTPAGERMIERARALLASTSDLTREMSLLRSGDLGDIALGAGALAGACLLPAALARLSGAHPEVRVDVDVIESNTLLDKLLRAGLDFFVGEYSEVPRHEDLRVEPLGRLESSFFCRSGHPLAKRSAVTPEDLARYRLASVHIPEAVQNAFDRQWAGAATPFPEFALQCGSLPILRDYVLTSDVVLLGCERPFQVELKHGLLVPLTVLDLTCGKARPPFSTGMGLVRLVGRTPTPAGTLLMDMIRVEAALALQPLQGSGPSRIS